MDPDQSICHVYRPVRQVKRCIHIKMLYVTSGDIFYLWFILLNRKAHSDKDILTYIPVCGGGKPIICTSYQQSAISHGYIDSVADVHATYDDMCTNGTGAQCRSYFVVLSLHGCATHVIFDDYKTRQKSKIVNDSYHRALRKPPLSECVIFCQRGFLKVRYC